MEAVVRQICAEIKNENKSWGIGSTKTVKDRMGLLHFTKLLL
jgi:hypothetical protein